MNEPEAFQLLTLASARDGRTVSSSVAKIWEEDLFDIPFDEAVVAVRAHFRERPDKWLMPGHIIENVNRARETRMPPRALPSAETCTHKVLAGACVHCGYLQEKP